MQVAENVTSLPLARPQTEQFRLVALQRYQLSDTAEADPDLDFLTALAARLCALPMACLSLVAGERVWFKAVHGVPAAALARDDSYCALTVLDAEITEFADVLQDYRTAGMAWTLDAPRVRHYCAAPLCSPDGYPIGTLAVLSDQPGQLSAAQRATLQQLARQVMAVLDRNAAQAALAGVLRERELLATTDDLTGLHNRRSLQQKLSFEVARARRFRSPLSALMLELDSVAMLRTELGHAAFEQVQASVGQLLRDNVRVIDVPSRYSDTLFCIMLPNTPLDGAHILAHNLRQKIAAQVHARAGLTLPVTVSLGIGALDFMAISEGQALLQQAESSLAQARRMGGDRVAYCAALPDSSAVHG